MLTVYPAESWAPRVRAHEINRSIDHKVLLTGSVDDADSWRVPDEIRARYIRICGDRRT